MLRLVLDLFVFLTQGGPVYTNPSFTKLSQS